MWFIGVELEQETSAPPPKKNPGSAPDFLRLAERMKGKLKKDQASHPSEECQGSCGWKTTCLLASLLLISSTIKY